MELSREMIDRIGDDAVLSAVQRTVCDCDADFISETTFRDLAGVEWTLPMYAATVGGRLVVWSHGDGACQEDWAIFDLADYDGAQAALDQYAAEVGERLTC